MIHSLPRVPGIATPPRPDLLAAVHRRRRAAALVLAGLVVVIVAILLLRGGGDSPPASGAARFVPTAVLAYVHVSTDRDRGGVQRALALARRFPGYPAARDRVLARLAPSGRPLSFQRDLAPWLGGEVGLALLDTQGPAASTLIVAAVADRGRAEAYLRAAGPASLAGYRGVRIRRYGNVAAALDGGYLLVGQQSDLETAIDAARGKGPALARDATFRRTQTGLPAGRVADGYVSPGGVRRLLAPQGGPLGIAGVLLDQPALAGVGLAVAARDGKARLTVRSIRDPRLARGRPPAFGTFTPRLAGSVPSGAMAYLGITGLDRAARRTLSIFAASGRAGARIQSLLQTRGRAVARRAGVDVDTDVLPLFRREVALFLTPALPSPYLTLIARTDNASQTRDALARLQAPLVSLFEPQTAQPGQEPTFGDRQVDGVHAFTLRLAPGVEVDYAVFDSKLVISTSLDGIRAVRRAPDRLVGSSPFRATLGDRPRKVTSLVFLDFSQLLGLGERTGLNANRRYLAVRGDLRRIRALGAATSGGGTESTTELTLDIS